MGAVGSPWAGALVVASGVQPARARTAAAAPVFTAAWAMAVAGALARTFLGAWARWRIMVRAAFLPALRAGRARRVRPCSTREAASALDAALGTSLFSPGLKLGTAATVLRF